MISSVCHYVGSVAQLFVKIFVKVALTHLAMQVAQLAAATAFYTCLPIPSAWALNFHYVARWAPLVGVIIGTFLRLMDSGLEYLGMPPLTRSVIVVIAWIGITGGLHLDGAMDTADGLAVPDPQRRLQVMADSATGAFGSMAAIALILLKIAAIADLHSAHPMALLLAAGWGRWAQQVAIARYPYLKPTGKGAFHKQAIVSLRDTIPSLILLLGLSILPLIMNPQTWQFVIAEVAGGMAIALLIPAWFNHQLGGHTGDTYGAVVEWTEALFLVLLTTVG
jgi:adenosylcobinamide-GDP ribazoletransferase